MVKESKTQEQRAKSPLSALSSQSPVNSPSKQVESEEMNQIVKNKIKDQREVLFEIVNDYPEIRKCVKLETQEAINS